MVQIHITSGLIFAIMALNGFAIETTISGTTIPTKIGVPKQEPGAILHRPSEFP
ncbi:hypothetical protein C8J56DRAFT_1040705 [Mycena floridula]|nr:hypothetical protein C8J56DRAFT_1040705 [Mycena floridula]